MKPSCQKSVVVVLVLFFSNMALPTIHNVPTDYTTIQAAVNASADGDTVLLAHGTYYEQVNVNFRRLTLAGGFLFSHDTLDRDSTIITIPDSIRHGISDQRSVIHVHHSDDFRLIGVTLRDGLGTGFQSLPTTEYAVQGGCLFADSSRLTLVGCRIIKGFAEGAGGLALQFGKIFLSETAFDSNQAVGGEGWSSGALFADTDSLIFLRNRFFHNSADAAGAFQAQARMFGIIDSCQIIENNCNNYAGGLLCFGITEICGNQIIGNRAIDNAGFIISNVSGWGGDGIFSNNVIRNNVKFGNYVDHGFSAGGIFQIDYSYHWEISNNVFDGNVNEGSGEGVLMLQGGIFDVHSNTFNGNIGGTFSTCIRILSRARATIDSNIFAYNVCTTNPNNSAIQFRQWPLSIRYNDFYGNAPCAINNCAATDSLHADHNWWGDASGPTSANNPGGHGDSVDFRIPYTPWLTSPVFPMAIKEPIISGIPTHFKLFQIAPNPFNSMTTIKYELQKQNQVEITLTDLTGRKVETLFRGNLNPGIHTTTFRGARYSSGTYFVHLRIGTQSQVKKVVLLK